MEKNILAGIANVCFIILGNDTCSHFPTTAILTKHFYQLLPPLIYEHLKDSGTIKTRSALRNKERNLNKYYFIKYFALSNMSNDSTFWTIKRNFI